MIKTCKNCSFSVNKSSCSRPYYLFCRFHTKMVKANRGRYKSECWKEKKY